jgi:hypothetical protein
LQGLGNWRTVLLIGSVRITQVKVLLRLLVIPAVLNSGAGQAGIQLLASIF